MDAYNLLVSNYSEYKQNFLFWEFLGMVSTDMFASTILYRFVVAIDVGSPCCDYYNVDYILQVNNFNTKNATFAPIIIYPHLDRVPPHLHTTCSTDRNGTYRKVDWYCIKFWQWQLLRIEK